MWCRKDISCCDCDQRIDTSSEKKIVSKFMIGRYE